VFDRNTIMDDTVFTTGAAHGNAVHGTFLESSPYGNAQLARGCGLGR